MKKSSGIKVAMIGQKHVLSREGGIEIVVRNLSERLVKHGFTVTCFDRSGGHVSGKKFAIEQNNPFSKVRIRQIPCIHAKGLSALTSSFIGTIMIAFGNYDLVHLHGEGICSFISFFKLFGKKTIVTVHGLDYRRAKWGKIGRFVIHHAEKSAVKHADRIIVLNSSTKQYFMDTYGKETVCIPNGIDPFRIIDDKAVFDRYGLKKNSYILFLSRLVPEKNPDLLIRAFKKVKADKKLVIAGGSSDSDAYVKSLHGIAENSGNVIFTGFVEGEMLASLFSNAYLYVLPSELEGMPISLLEAMSYGNCCLVSDIEECSSVVEDHGVTFRCNDENDLRNQLQKLLDHPETVDEYRRNAAAYIQKKYSWEKMTEETIKVYQEVLS